MHSNYLTHFIRNYPAQLHHEICELIIRRFEADTSHHSPIQYPQHRSFTEINIHQSDHWDDIQQLMMKKIKSIVALYQQDIGIADVHWPDVYGFEQIRIKRYLPETHDEFREHVDVGDHSSARRFLACFWYLNTVERGGETVFTLPYGATPFAPLEGSALVFPPLWLFPHAGKKPISSPKYIIGSYLHYL